MIACLSVSYFAATVERRDNSGLADTPLVVGGQPWEPRPLFGYSREVAQRGVRPGMSLRLAHVLSPHSHFIPTTLSRYQDAAGEVVDVLTDFTHLVEPENLWQPRQRSQPALTAADRCLPAHYYVDLESLPSGEAVPLVREIGRTVRRQTRLAAAVGLAADRFTAHVAATLARPSHVRPVEPQTERDFLAEQSISFLPLERETVRRLRLLGIRTLGQFAALSPVAVQEQFGAEVLPLYYLAQGRAEQRACPPPPQPGPQVTRHFEPPLDDGLTLRNVLQQMATALAGQLQDDHRAAGALVLTIEMDGDGGQGPGRQEQRIELRQPTANAGQLAQHLRNLQERLSWDAAIGALTLSAADLAPWTAQQLSLFRPVSAHKVDQALPGIVARHRATRFYRPILGDRAHPLPERRFQLQPLL
ncbi:MAG: DNA polymerase Y family protein [bacterium]